MKLKFLVALVSLIIGEREPDADMYLPSWLLAFGAVLIILFPVLIILFFIKHLIICLVLALPSLLLGILAVICWHNQNIKVLSDSEFQYSTFLGNKKIYRFADITGFRKNSDSITLFVGGEKVHIEACAVMSERLIDLIDKALDNIGGGAY